MSKGPHRPASRCHKPQLMLVMLGPGAHYDGIWVVWEGFSPFFASLHHFPAMPENHAGRWGGLGGVGIGGRVHGGGARGGGWLCGHKPLAQTL